MEHQTRRPWGKLLTIVTVAMTPLMLFWRPIALAQEKGAVDPVAKFGSGAIKFHAAGSCGGEKCHAQPNAAPQGQSGIEYTVWRSSDPHQGTFTSLTKPSDPKLVDIAKKLNIPDATKSERCLSCHALNVPAAMKQAGPKGELLSLKEGISCDACHGPSEKYFDPHSKKGWLEEQRKTLSHDQLLKTWGLYDTKPAVARAEKCVTCHLAIDQELVKAGHPQPVFELAYYSKFDTFSNDKQHLANHWRDPAGYFDAKLWAAGQAVCLRDAMNQLATRAAASAPPESLKDAYEQAMGHYAVFKQLLLTKAVAGNSAAMDEAAGKISAAMKANGAKDLAAAATAMAGVAVQSIAAVGAYDPDKDPASVQKVLAAIAADAAIARESGLHGIEQQALAISTLYGAYATGKNVAKGRPRRHQRRHRNALQIAGRQKAGSRLLEKSGGRGGKTAEVIGRQFLHF